MERRLLPEPALSSASPARTREKGGAGRSCAIRRAGPLRTVRGGRMEPAPRLIHNIRSGGNAQRGRRLAGARQVAQSKQQPKSRRPPRPRAPPLGAAPANRALRAARDWRAAILKARLKKPPRPHLALQGPHGRVAGEGRGTPSVGPRRALRCHGYLLRAAGPQPLTQPR